MCGDNCYIELPLRANWGGHHLHLGSNIYINSNFTIVDDGHIYVGDKAMFGPNVIGAGSVVTHDIPDNVVAVGNPCKVLREVSDRDKKYFYKEELIDWDSM